MPAPRVPKHHRREMTILRSRMRCSVCGTETRVPKTWKGGKPPIHCGVPMLVARDLKCEVCGHETTDTVSIEAQTPEAPLPTVTAAPPVLPTRTAQGLVGVKGPVGGTWAGYEIVSVVGQGGMGVVYKAYQPSLNRHVAIKFLIPGGVPDSSLIARFKQEAQLIAGLRHPNIVTVLDFGEKEGSAYLVMEYVEGEALSARLGSPMPPDQALRITSQVAAALGHAHQHGVVHRDVKPSNILLATDDWALLTDFGIAKVLQSAAQMTQTGMTVGTPEYMSPEQCRGAEIDGRSDVYSLGVVLYELLTGRPPFVADTPVAIMFMHASEPMPPPRQFNPGIPAAAEQIVLRATAKDPSDRYASAKEMAQALESGRGAEAPPLIQTRAAGPMAAFKPRGRTSTLVLTPVMLAIFAAIVLLMFSAASMSGLQAIGYFFLISIAFLVQFAYATLRDPVKRVAIRPRILMDFRTPVAPGEVVRAVVQFARATGRGLEELDEAGGRLVLSDPVSPWSFGFFYPIYLSKQSESTQVEVGVKPRLGRQRGSRRLRKVVDGIKEAIASPEDPQAASLRKVRRNPKAIAAFLFTMIWPGLWGAVTYLAAQLFPALEGQTAAGYWAFSGYFGGAFWALVQSTRALREIKRSGEAQRGRALAIVALVLGSLQVVFFTVGFVGLTQEMSAFLPGQGTPRTEARAQACKSERRAVEAVTPLDPPPMTIDVSKTYKATIETSEGPIVLELAGETSTCTVNSFVFLARRGFYDGLTFHRVVPGFVIQGGDPMGDGRGGPGYQVVEAPPANTKYIKGTAAMARTGSDPAGTSGSQFFIVTGDGAASLNGTAESPAQSALLGKVVGGFEVLSKIEAVPRGKGAQSEKPSRPITIVKITITE